MNYRLSDGTVRCEACMDASSYQGITTDPCLYCEVWGSVDGQEHETTPEGPIMHTYAVIMSHPEDDPGEGLLVHVAAPTRGSAQDEVNGAVQDPQSIYHGYQFTIWPVPC